MPSVIFGDVHGDVSRLTRLIQIVRSRFGQDVTLYSVGDLVDRGPDSKGVLELCVAEGVLGILGNHELWLCSVLAGRAMTDEPYQSIMGGIATLRSFGLSKGDPDRVGPALRAAVPSHQRDWLLRLPPFRFIHVAGVKYGILHTGLSSHIVKQVRAQVQGISDHDVLHVTATRATDAFFWAGVNPKEPDKVARFSFTQVFGHRPITAVRSESGHFIALDTGCGTCPPYTLSAVVLHDDGRAEFIHA